MSKKILVSIIILSYNNLEYLNQCIDSVLCQTYENIELIISNDGADEFNVCEVERYIQSRKPGNITNLYINHNNENVGTVKHCNIALEFAKGDYIMFIACDDMYSNDGAVSDMVNAFSIAPTDTLCIVGQTRMCNNDLTEVSCNYVSKETQEQINSLTPFQLYQKCLSLRPILPSASLIYKREAYSIFGKYDESYFLIEDWSSTIAFARKGLKFYFVDITCVDHRDGGVSHSGHDPNNFAHKMYTLDHIKIAKDLLRHKNDFTPEVITSIKDSSNGTHC